MKLIKRVLLPAYEFIKVQFLAKKPNFKIEKNKINVIQFLFPDYRNVGDLAIGYAQTKFIEKNFSNYNIINIHVKDTYKYMKYIMKHINANDIITLIGGGNFGDLYPIADYMRMYIVKKFKNNKIVSFPQTIKFTDTKFGKQRYAKNVDLISKHNNISLFAREEISYNEMKNSFPNTPVYLVPDIVLSLQMHKKNERDGIVLSFRSDEEKSFSKEQERKLIKQIEKKYKKIIYRDTTIPAEEFDYSKREEYIKLIADTFSKGKVVVTDRLHGMIFSFITKTPCVVITNNNHKILSTYNTWLKKYDFIRCFENLDISNVIKAIEELENIQVKIESFEEKYAPLKKILERK